MAVAARLHLALPLVMIAIIVVAAVCSQCGGESRVRTVLMIAALCSIVGWNSNAQFTPIDSPQLGAIHERCAVRSDPQERFGSVRVIVSCSGHRYLASMSNASWDALGGTIGAAQYGDSFVASGRVRPSSLNRDYRASRHIEGELSIRSATSYRRGSFLFAVANTVRSMVSNVADQLSTEQQAIVEGIVMGDTRLQSPVSTYAFQQSGLAHLTAVSGQNVAFVLIIFSPLLCRLYHPSRFGVIAAVLLILVVVTRCEPSVLRASTMALVAAFFALRGRYGTTRRIVALSVGILLVVDPLLTFSLGFQLSVVATVCLIEAEPLISRTAFGHRGRTSAGKAETRTRSRGVQWLYAGFLGTVVAQTATAPLLLAAGISFPLAGFVTNIVAIPVAGAIMMYGLCGSIINLVAVEPLSSIVAMPLRGLSQLLLAIAHIGSTPVVPTCGWIGFFGLLGISFVAVLWIRGAQRKGRSLTMRWVFALSVSLACVGVLVVDASQRHDFLVEHRGVVIERKSGVTVALVSGPASTAAVLRTLRAEREQRLDVVIVVGGGSTSSTLIYELRLARTVDTVFASDTALVKDSVQINGFIRIDNWCVDPLQIPHHRNYNDLSPGLLHPC